MGIRYKVNENFFRKWGRDMAYILGYLFADGSLEDASYIRGKYIRVTSIDHESILRIKKYLSSEHKIVVLPPRKIGQKTRYFLRIGNHILYKSLQNRGLYPNKSLTIKLPHVPQMFVSDFVRGYFDGDGCVFLYRTLGIKKKFIIKKLSIIFTSGSHEFLDELCQILKIRLDLKHAKVYKSHRSFQLRYSTRDTIKVFYFMYSTCPRNLCLKRKLKSFMKYFKYRPQRVDSTIRYMLKRLR